jgi:alcohol oxidase
LQIETYHPQVGNDNHGYNGPLHVSYGGSNFKIGDEYEKAALSFASTEPTVDTNDFVTVNKTSRWPKWIHPGTGQRSDAAHGYVHPVRDVQDNLHLLLNSTVIRVIFEGTKAVGIEYVETRYHPLSPLNVDNIEAKSKLPKRRRQSMQKGWSCCLRER